MIEVINSKTKVKIKKLNDKAIIPTSGSEYAAGYDLYACTNTPIVIAPHETVMIGTGLAIETPNGYASLIFARSGLASKQGLAPANKIGLVDSDFRGEVKVALHNHSNIPQMINPMERIAQLVIMPYLPVEFEETDELSETKRGSGGFGSTGK